MRDLIGAVLAVLLIIVSIQTFAPTIYRYENRALEDSAASRVELLDLAQQNYLTTAPNYSNVLAAAASSVVVVTPTQLKTAGVLDPAFVDSNEWGQNHVVLYRLVAAGQLQGMVATCGGSATPDGTLVRLSLNVQNDGAAILSSAPTFASAGQKQQAIAPFANPTCPLTVGHLVALTYFDNGSVIPPYINSKAVPGDTTFSANTMQTNLYMGGYNIQNVADITEPTKINANGSIAKLSQAITGFSITTDGGTVAQITCPGGVTPNAALLPIGLVDPTGRPIIGWDPELTSAGNTLTAHITSYTQSTTGGNGVADASADNPAVGPNGSSKAVVIQSCP